MDKLVNQGIIDFDTMVRLFTVGPAALVNLDRGTLTPGKTADVTIIDPNLKRKVDIMKFCSKGKNTPFKGMQLQGWPFMTIVNGLVVAREGKVV
jgi:dihydroorotase